MKKNFTLIELIVVIAIIAILAAIIAPNAFRAIEKAKISKMAGDFKTMKTAWLTLYSDVGEFPIETDYVAAGVPRYRGIGQFMNRTDIGQDVLDLPGWEGPYYEGPTVSPWAADYLYDNDNNDIYDPTTPWGPFGGVNVALYEGDFSGNTEDIITKMDLMIDDNNATNGSLRHTAPPMMRIFYLIYVGGG